MGCFKKGDTVEAEQSVIEVETDKVVLEVPVENDGIIDELLITEGEVVKVGQVIARIKVISTIETDISVVDSNQEPITSKDHVVDSVVEKNR